MLQDLAVFTQQLLQQVLVTVGSAEVLVLAAVAGRYVSRLLRGEAKAPQVHLFKIAHGAVRVAVVITIGGSRRGRKSLNDAKDGDRDGRRGKDANRFPAA